MKSTSARRADAGPALALALCLLASNALAGAFNGGPAYNGVFNAKYGAATGKNGVGVALTPNPALYRSAGDCSWLRGELTKEGTAEGWINAANKWNFSYVALTEDPTKNSEITVSTYRAWAETVPNISLPGSKTYGGANPGRGGAEIVLNYKPSAADLAAGDPNPAWKNGIPTGATPTMNWIQVLHDNAPIAFEKTNGTAVGGGYYNTLDNEGNGAKPTDPYYGHLTNFDTVKGGGFLDAPSRDLVAGVNWQAQAFLSSETDVVAAGVTTHNVTIYDGVWWGFSMTPEPGTWVMLLTGVGCFALVGRRGLAGKTNAAA